VYADWITFYTQEINHPMHLAVLSRSLVTVQILFQWKPKSCVIIFS